MAFDLLRNRRCAEAVKPEWWNDEALKALSASVVETLPNHNLAKQMRAHVLSGQCIAWKAGPRSAAELLEAALLFAQAAAMHCAPAMQASLAGNAEYCLSQAQAM